MSDPIDRQVAIESVADEIWHYPNECYKNLNVFENAKDLAEHALRGLPSAQPEQRWIPCSERLPEEGEIVLTQANIENMISLCVASRQDYNYWKGWNTREINVVAWMPLPEPYREERTEE